MNYKEKYEALGIAAKAVLFKDLGYKSTSGYVMMRRLFKGETSDDLTATIEQKISEVYRLFRVIYSIDSLELDPEGIGFSYDGHKIGFLLYTTLMNIKIDAENTIDQFDVHDKLFVLVEAKETILEMEKESPLELKLLIAKYLSK